MGGRGERNKNKRRNTKAEEHDKTIFIKQNSDIHALLRERERRSENKAKIKEHDFDNYRFVKCTMRCSFVFLFGLPAPVDQSRSALRPGSP